MERIQKVALRLILGEYYTNYIHALKETKLSLKFAIKCVENDQTTHMFPKNGHLVDTRHHETFHVTMAQTSRLSKSAIPYMQRLLNDYYKRK